MNTVCSPCFASNGKTTCRTKKSSRKPAYPSQTPSCLKKSCAGLAMSQGWKIYACVQYQQGLHIKNPTLQPPTNMQKLTINLPKILVHEKSATIQTYILQLLTWQPSQSRQVPVVYKCIWRKDFWGRFLMNQTRHQRAFLVSFTFFLSLFF